MEKKEKYTSIRKQIGGLIDGEADALANLANITAVLKEVFGFFWVGFYLVKDDELVLGPFQGPVACTRIAKGKGVCGTSWAEKKSYLVPDVHQFPGHIACNANSASEVVIPVFMNDEVIMVLDVDSDALNDFNQVDVEGLEVICELIGNQWNLWS
jgi:L-methionine (R)-S-oxide reductase